MKKFLNLFLLVLGLAFISCQNQKPETSFKSSGPCIMTVGDSAVYEVYHAKKVAYWYGENRDESKPVFAISNFEGSITTIYALHPGTDTLWVSTEWTEGTSMHALSYYTLIRVIEE